jgi:hypothetical protein
MVDITIIEIDLNNPNYLHFQYQGQCNPQPCYIELDCENEEMTADYNSEIGNGVPGKVWHDRILRFSIPCINSEAANALMKSLLPLAEKIVDGYECIWNGSNHIGTFTEEAQEAREEFGNICEDFDASYCYCEVEEEN